MRVAIYARVSTNGKNGNGDEQSRRRHRQDTDNQLFHLREWCSKAGHEIVEEYVEQVSGGAGKEKRSEFARMFEDAHKQRFDIVLCWALDRFSREGMMPTIGYLQRLAAAGVGFHSYTEPKLSTDNEMIRDIVLAVMASLAKQERLRHVEHPRWHCQRADQGNAKRKADRPPVDRQAERGRHSRGARRIRKTARLCKVETGTVQRVKKEIAT